MLREERWRKILRKAMKGQPGDESSGMCNEKEENGEVYGRVRQMLREVRCRSLLRKAIKG